MLTREKKQRAWVITYLVAGLLRCLQRRWLARKGSRGLAIGEALPGGRRWWLDHLQVDGEKQGATSFCLVQWCSRWMVAHREVSDGPMRLPDDSKNRESRWELAGDKHSAVMRREGGAEMMSLAMDVEIDWSSGWTRRKWSGWSTVIDGGSTLLTSSKKMGRRRIVSSTAPRHGWDFNCRLTVPHQRHLSSLSMTASSPLLDRRCGIHHQCGVLRWWRHLPRVSVGGEVEVEEGRRNGRLRAL